MEVKHSSRFQAIWMTLLNFSTAGPSTRHIFFPTFPMTTCSSSPSELLQMKTWDAHVHPFGMSHEGYRMAFSAPNSIPLGANVAHEVTTRAHASWNVPAKAGSLATKILSCSLQDTKVSAVFEDLANRSKEKLPKSSQPTPVLTMADGRPWQQFIQTPVHRLIQAPSLRQLLSSTSPPRHPETSTSLGYSNNEVRPREYTSC